MKPIRPDLNKTALSGLFITCFLLIIISEKYILAPTHLNAMGLLNFGKESLLPHADPVEGRDGHGAWAVLVDGAQEVVELHVPDSHVLGKIIFLNYSIRGDT